MTLKNIATTFNMTLLAVCLSSCTANADSTKKNPPLPYDNWTYVFMFPGKLYAGTTYVRFLDTDGYLNQNPLPDLTTSDRNSVDHWRKDIWRNTAIANKGTMPPQWIQFCWDSLVDKKLYETTVEFPPKVWTMMRTPLPTSNGPWYHDNMIIGLAPQGKVRVWFHMPDEHGGENVQIAEGKTVSGEDLTVCKGKSQYPKEYPEMDNLKKVIQGKKYPYGNW